LKANIKNNNSGYLFDFTIARWSVCGQQQWKPNNNATNKQRNNKTNKPTATSHTATEFGFGLL